MPDAIGGTGRLKRRAQFLRVAAHGRKGVGGGVVV
jgi:hypothetical protein